MDILGNLYGVFNRAGPHGSGAVYQLSRSGSGWIERTIYGFTGGDDGAMPFGGLLQDGSGNFYGTTTGGGVGGKGTVFELTPSNGGWSFNTLYSFSGPDGYFPEGKLAMDASGSLYGTTVDGGASGFGTVYKLMPSNGVWTEMVLYSFTGGADGWEPLSSVVLDATGDLYSPRTIGNAPWAALAMRL